MCTKIYCEWTFEVIAIVSGYFYAATHVAEIGQDRNGFHGFQWYF